MSIVEQKQKIIVENFIQSAEEAKHTLKTIEEKIQNKSELHSRTINTIKDKCRTQFETQRNNWEKYEEKCEERQNAFSLNAVNKFDAQRTKSKEITKRVN